MQTPMLLIIPSSDAIAVFKNNVGNNVSRMNLEEIIYQILEVFTTEYLLHEKHDFLYRLAELPDFTRLTLDPVVDKEVVRKATYVLATSFLMYFMTIGIFDKKVDTENKHDFPFFFNSFLGADIVLEHIPF